MTTLLTPDQLARPAINIPAEETKYDASSQTRYAMQMNGCIRPMATTFNGTQTFDHKGQPKDSDNDK